MLALILFRTFLLRKPLPLSQHASLGFISSTTTHAPSHLLPNLTVLPPTRPSRGKQRNDKPLPLDSDERAGENNIKDRHLRAWTEEAGQRSRTAKQESEAGPAAIRLHCWDWKMSQLCVTSCSSMYIRFRPSPKSSPLTSDGPVRVPRYDLLLQCNQSPTSPLHQPKQ